MKNRNGIIIGFLLCAMIAMGSGCGSLDKTGVYGGDKFLYDSDLTLASSYVVLHNFVKWEFDNRPALAGMPEVTKYADDVRKGAPQWYGSAWALRDAYKANPNGGTRTALQTALDVIREAVTQATKYMAAPGQSAAFSALPAK